MQKEIDSLNPNPLVRHLQKPAKDFTKEDIIKFISENGIEMVNFRYAGEDRRLKTLNFIINGRKHLDSILSAGERVDGSSLFSYVEAGSSDLYVIPRYSTAFVNPFSVIPAIDILCSYFNKDGEPLASAPENTLRKAHLELQRVTGFSMEAMCELEYYMISKKDELYPATDQKGYHESFPFAKWEAMRAEIMRAIAQSGGIIKYGHSEVGNFCDGDTYYEQNEIEFSPCPLEEAADQVLIAKWIIQMVGYKYGVKVSMAPKIVVGKAGSGLHVHMKLTKEGKNVVIEKGVLSDTAKKAIAGILELAPSLTALGNTIPTSYLRLVPHQEAPTCICWGDRNRSVLVRVPLGWVGSNKMIQIANPNYKEKVKDYSDKQTFELRSADASADIYMLFAGLAVAIRHGLEKKHALEFADKLYVDVNIFKKEHKSKCDSLKLLPASCFESAEALDEQRNAFMKYHVFTAGHIDGIINKLKAYNDKNLSERLYGKNDEIAELVEKYMYC